MSSSAGEMARLVQRKDWSQTPLGPMDSWPQSLRTAVSLCLASNFPINIVWGPSHIQIYNDGYRVCCGDAHPRALGEDYSVTWASAWPAIGEPFARALAGQASYLENQRMFLSRNGYLEETFFTFSHSPIHEEGGGIGGLFHPVTETTATMLSARRNRALRDLGASLARAEAEADLASRSIDVLSRHEFDLPFLLIYALEVDGSGYRLAAHHGIETPAAAAPQRLELGSDEPWPVARALQAAGTVEVVGVRSFLDGVPCGAYEEAPDRAMVVPIRISDVERPALLLVAGVSPRLPLDDEYRSFYDLLAVTVAGALASLRAREGERRRAEMLIELDRAKTAFFSNVSHEFRTPLTLMLGPVEDLLAEGGSTPAHKQQLELVHRNALRLLKLVNTLLDFARIEAGRARANYQATDLAAFTAELASSFRSACERAGLRLVIACSPLPEPVHVDRDMWEKIVLNLVSNAFKFTLAGEIAVTLGAHDGRARLTVADTGLGIPEDELPRMFERFHRGKQTQGRTHEGTGIGLALVQELARLHGGEVGVQSVLGGGSRFTVGIPFGTAHLDARHIDAETALASTAIASVAYVEEAQRWLTGDPADTGVPALPTLAAPTDASSDAPPEGPRPRVLWADDNADMRDYVSRLLGARFDVEAVADGLAALQAARRRLPDLVLSDVMMPGLDGIGLLRELRADPATRAVPVILLSARAGEESRIEGMEEGADDYLIKPFSARELVARLETHVKLARVRRAAADAVRLRGEQFQTLLDQAPIGVYLVDADFRIREVNPIARPVFGSIEGGAIGRDFDEVIHILWQRDYADEVVRIFRHTLTTGEPYVSAERSEFRVDLGRTEYYEWRVDRIALPDGRHGVVCYFRDVSTHVHAREALRVADRRKDEFLATLAHELRNPLAPIRNALHLLSTADADVPAERLHEMLNRQVGHLVRLVDDLMEASRISRGELELKREPLDLADVLRTAIETSKPLIDGGHHALSVSLPDQPLPVDGDAVRLAQVFANLLNNAAKYTDDGGRIELAASREGDWVQVSVRDNGIGVAAEQLPRLFEMFAQLDGSHARAQGGLGIGLSLAQRLTQMHGGSLQVASDGPGHGTTFTVRLPLAHSTTAAASRPPTADGLNARRILVLDDDRDGAESLGMLLRFLGAEVRVEHDGDKALVTARTWRPAVALLDLGMPGLDGFEVARRLRADSALAGVKLIALTGWGQEQDRQRTRAAGFDHHLIKPVDINVLHALLASLQEAEMGEVPVP